MAFMAPNIVLHLVVATVLIGSTQARCPMAGMGSKDNEADMADDLMPTDHHHRALMAEAAKGVNYEAVKKDIKALLTDSKEFWPADFGNYGPLFIRQAWHCSGSYRASDGRGGCDGGRQRFDPERSWGDNANLDKPKVLLQPIKLKYGRGLSWGDLFVLAGNVAIESMGGPVLGFCGGRVDDVDGSSSLELGRSLAQRQVAPCPVQGDCPYPLGPSVIGDIYVNPAGFMGVPDPGKETIADIRGVFSRMNFNDSETVALVGGGHAFGKTHGACTGRQTNGDDADSGTDGPDQDDASGAGFDPDLDPFKPWKGSCGNGTMRGKGNNTFTSGFEGPWTTHPTKWSNTYFKNLLFFDWQLHTGPGGNPQWRPIPLPGGPQPPAGIMMLTTDVANKNDPEYSKLVEAYAADIKVLENDFEHAWYKLTTQDMGPATRCLGNSVPPAQPFQDPLPPTPKKLADFEQVRKDILKLLYAKNMGHILEPDVLPDGRPYYGALLVNLAYQCASTFRATDYRGGCNGARIRFSPQKDWPVNIAMNQVIQLLDTIKSKFPASKGALSWSDLIVFAGTTAIIEAGGKMMPFCPGRTDAKDGGSNNPFRNWYPDPFTAARDNMKVMGLTAREMVALQARPRSPTQQLRLGYSGSWTDNPSKISNAYYKTLINNEFSGWQSAVNRTNTSVSWKYSTEGHTKNQTVFMTSPDLAIKYNTTWLADVQDFASDNNYFLTTFASAWNKLMVADRFMGPTGNQCGEKGLTGIVHTVSMNPVVMG